MYTLNLGAWNSVFAVPADFADKYLKFTTGTQLKVLLWVLRNAGRPIAGQEIARCTGCDEKEAQEALAYWVEAGVLGSDGTESAQQLFAAKAPAQPVFAPQEAEAVQAPPPAAKVSVPDSQPDAAGIPAPRRISKPDSLYIANRVQADKNIQLLMQEAQTIMGTVISPGLSSSLLYLCDDCGLPADVLVMLLQYAKNIGRANTRYIETVGEDWARNGIFSIEEAEKKLTALDSSARAWKRIEGVLGISHRMASKKETDYAYSWILLWKMSDEMIAEAYERCVDSTGKLSLSYMNRVLERWYASGILTPQAAREDAKKRTAKKQEAAAASFDIDAFEQLSRENLQKGIIV